MILNIYIVYYYILEGFFLDLLLLLYHLLA